MNATTTTCRTCDGPVERRPGRGRPKLYCSDECRATARRARNRQAMSALRGRPSCLECGSEVLERYQRVCSDRCQRERALRQGRRRAGLPDMETHTCGACGQDWRRPPTRGQVPTYCPDCRSGQRQITCEFCGRLETVSYAATGTTCSQKCAQRLRCGWSTSKAIEVWQRPRRERPKPPPDRKPWTWFGGSCQRCGDAFVIPHQLENRYCSRRCARADAKDRRRASQKAAFVAPVYRRRIFERDGWRCQLCGKAVNRRATAPHPKAPVLDHIVPLDPTVGGTHEPANVQCAHFLCNSIKRSEPANDQLRLIG